MMRLPRVFEFHLAAVLLCTLVPFAFGQEHFYGVDGVYAVGSKSWTDPKAGERKDRALFFLKGETARQIYESMPVAAHKDRCDAYLLTKSANNLECSKARDDTYRCTFGLLLQKGQVVKVEVC